MHRRKFLALLPAALAARPARAETFELTRSDAEWRALLSDRQFAVLRLAETEGPNTSPLNAELRAGTYSCAGCALPLFASDTKFDSGTGWPSFWQPLANAVATQRDISLLGIRTEVHCRRCGGHLGSATSRCLPSRC